MSEHTEEQVVITIPKGRMVGFGDSIGLFFKNFFAFEGRSSRGAYWWVTLALVILTIITMMIDGILFPGNPATPVSNIFSLLTLVPSISVSVRRLHDIGRSGWWVLLVFTIIGIIPIIFWACKPGDRAENKFGADVEAGR